MSSKTTEVPDAIAQQCVAVRLRILNRVITNAYDDALRPFGLKASQMNILVVAARLGRATPAAVCQRLQLDASTLSRNVERMRSKGWLDVIPDEDGRAQPFRLTQKGKNLLQRVFPAWQQAQRKAEAIIGEEGIALLHQVVDAIRSERTKA